MAQRTLQDKIAVATATLTSGSPGADSFDPEAYGSAFHDSAREKAREVLRLLSEETRLANKRPVFVSVGGADGEEIEFLLRGSNGEVGILIEMVPPLAEVAKRRKIPGKRLDVLQMPAQEGITAAMGIASAACREGFGEALVVSCHAVLHELYDRGGQVFDLLQFFGTIFAHDDLPTWFTYREPGAPEKWPDQILVAADCPPQSLLLLAKAIYDRHKVFRELSPAPGVLGDGIRVHKVLGMELLHKLFYLEDLAHEIEERATSVDHPVLQNALITAMGNRAHNEDRVSVTSVSSSTKSFISKWQQLKVKVSEICGDCSTRHLPIPESQTRVVGWRMPPPPKISNLSSMASDIAVAREAFDQGEDALLESLLLSRGRSWIESPSKVHGLDLLREVAEKTEATSTMSLWSRYLLSLDELFKGKLSAIQMFEKWADVRNSAFAILFRAEEMEFSRKGADLSRALKTANALLSVLSTAKTPSSDLERYAVGTANLLVSNFLRSGGRYDEAASFITSAENMFNPSIPSHAAELAHCFYAKQVCIAMTGLASFSPSRSEVVQKFAAALIQIAYSHAAWFIGEIAQAKEHSAQAARLFTELDMPGYLKRAKSLESLLGIWGALAEGRTADLSVLDEELQRGVAELISQDPAFIVAWIPKLRPSTAVGLLQFSRRFSKNYGRKIELRLPRTLERQPDGSLSWFPSVTVYSLEQADFTLRAQIGISRERVIPLIAD
jgi:hypothetical protein